MEKLKIFCKEIDFELPEEFKNTKVDKVVVNKHKQTWNVHLKSKNVLPALSVLKLKEKCKKGIKDVSLIEITFIYDEVKDEDILSYLKFYVDLLTKKYPS